MPRLSNIERERAIGMLNTGTSVTDVARAMGCSRRTIHDLRTRLQHTGTTADRPRSGRPRVTTQAEDRQIVLRHLRNRFVTATSTRNELFRGRITAQTIRNRLRTAGLHARRPYRGPILTQLHRRQRLLWARRHLRWTQRDWNRVVFSDESRFTTLTPSNMYGMCWAEDFVKLGTLHRICRNLVPCWYDYGDASPKLCSDA